MTVPGAVVFRTKVDAWLLAVIVTALCFALWTTVAAIRRSPGEGWVGLAVVIGAIVLVVAIAVPTEYVLTDRELVVRSGVVRSTIPLDSIERVYPTHNPLSAPAWSLDRLAIEHRSGRSRRTALISPGRRPEFLEALQARAPLERSGAGLVRRA